MSAPFRHLCILLLPMKDLQPIRCVWLHVCQQCLDVVCFVCMCHIERKIYMCSQALSDKAHPHSKHMHDDGEPFKFVS